MLHDEEIDDHENGDGDEDAGNGVRNANGLLAEAYILGKLVPKTRRQYELCIDKMTAWIRIHNPEGYDNSLKQMILPLSEKIIMEFLASVSIHKKKVSAGGAPSTVSISTVNSPRDVVRQMLS